MSTTDNDAFLAANRGKPLKWHDITKALGLTAANDLKRAGKIEKSSTGLWAVK